MRNALFFVFTLALVYQSAGGLRAQDEAVFSGPQVGEKIVPFTVLGVYDEAAGKDLDFVKQAEGEPLLLVFVQKLTRPGAALTRTLTKYAHSRLKDGLHAAVVWIVADRSAAEKRLKFARRSLDYQVPVGISKDGEEGPGSYGLNRNVELTILLANKNRVTANFALVQPSVTEAVAIAKHIVKLVGGKEPTPEEMTRLAYPGGAYKRNAERMERMRQQNESKLRELIRDVIAQDATPEQLKKAVAAMERFVGRDRGKAQQLGRMCGFVLERGLGTKPAQKQIRKWKEKYGSAKDGETSKERERKRLKV